MVRTWIQMQVKMFIKQEQRRPANPKRESISRSKRGGRSDDVQTTWQTQNAKILSM